MATEKPDDAVPAEVAPVAACPKPAPRDPQEELKDLKDKAKQYKEDSDHIAKSAAALQQDIAVLEAGLTEIEQVVKAYQAQSGAATKDLGDLGKFVDVEGRKAVAAVGAGRPALDKIIEEADGEIERLKDSVAKLQVRGDQAAAALKDADKAVGNATADSDRAKATATRIQKAIAELKALKAQVTAASDAGSSGSMYFLVVEMAAVGKGISTPSADELRTALNAALEKLKAAKADARDKKAVAEAAAAALAAAQKKLADAITGRRATLLAALKGWVAPDPAAAKAPPPMPKSAKE